MAIFRPINAILMIASLAVLSVPAQAQSLLTPHQAEYKVKISVLGGQLNTELTATETGYIATHTIQPTGMSRMLASGQIAETARFARVPSGIRPQTFESTDTLTRDKTRASVQFDWDLQEASGTVNDEDFKSAMEGPAFDRVSIQYELMSDLLNNNTVDEYVLLDIDRLKKVQVRHIGNRTVNVPAGEFEAVGVQHQTIGSKRITTMWCVAELDYLPVIIEQHRKGKLKMRAVLSNYRLLST